MNTGKDVNPEKGDGQPTASEHKEPPGGFVLQLRLIAAEAVLYGLRRKGWTRRQLANETGFTEEFIADVLCGDTNLALSDIATLVQAFDARIEFCGAVEPKP